MPPPTDPLPFLFNDTATTEIYTLSLHDALPIFPAAAPACAASLPRGLSPPLRRRRRRWSSSGWSASRVSRWTDRKSTRLNSSHANISYAVFCLKKKNEPHRRQPHRPAL